MTPQQLIDLPHAGMAEKQLRMQKDWHLTPSEKLEEIIDKLGGAIQEVSYAASDAETYLNDLETAMESPK